jgi:probable HAF family extracellular repeat protein
MAASRKGFVSSVPNADKLEFECIFELTVVYWIITLCGVPSEPQYVGTTFAGMATRFANLFAHTIPRFRQPLDRDAQLEGEINMFRIFQTLFTRSAAAALCAAVLLAVFLCAAPARADATYTVTDLGTLGGDVSDGYALNIAGDTTGLAYLNTTTNNHHAFLNDGTTDTDLGTLGGDYSTGAGINKSEVVVGKAEASSGFYNAFIYISPPMSDLGTLGGYESFATGVNDSNEVVGGATDASGQQHAFYYISTMKEIPTGNDDYSQADAISDSGDVVGTYVVSAGEQHAFLYSIPTGKFIDLGTLSGQVYAEAFAINGRSVEAGASGNDDSTSLGFIYTGGVMTELPTLGGAQTEALGINDSSVVVGYSQTSASVYHAFIYDDEVMTDLNTMIDPTSGWVLSNAYGINDAGQIVGTGTINGATHGYLLNPVIPTPVIDSLDPATGVAGQQVTIAGSNFGSSPVVRFNGVKASIDSSTSTQIVAAVPATATTGPVTVANEGVTGTSVPNFVISKPTITSLSEYAGLAGDSLVITGTNFVSVESVTFAGSASAVFTVGSPTSITATVPANGITGLVKVTTRGGDAHSPKPFTYRKPTITKFKPGSGPVGTTVTITGTNFAGVSSVTFNGTSASYSVNSTTSITATVPTGATSGQIGVTTPGGEKYSAADFTVN